MIKKIYDQKMNSVDENLCLYYSDEKVWICVFFDIHNKVSSIMIRWIYNGPSDQLHWVYDMNLKTHAFDVVIVSECGEIGQRIPCNDATRLLSLLDYISENSGELDKSSYHAIVSAINETINRV